NSSHSWGNIYYPEVDQMIYGIDINFATGTTADLYVLARVQEMDASGSIQDPLTYNNETDHTVVSSEIGSSITTITFPSPSLLEAGKGYIIDVLKVDGTTGPEAMYFGGTDASQEDDDFSTVGYGPFGAANAINYFSGWDFAPYIRANFDASLDVTVNTLEGVAVFPNPSQGEITITNNNGDANAIEITNLAGQVVYTVSVSAATTVDLGSFGSGVYLVKVSNGIGSLVERVVIK
ncbi:MAG: T9SS type A sorting domain-containing protein, partial [Crocinitomicaceae bacterium]